MKIETFEIDKPSNIEKELHFEVDGIHYRIFITTSFLVPLSDGNYELNCYNDFYKVCGEAKKKKLPETQTLFARFECPIFHKEELNKVWDKYVNEIIKMATTLNDNMWTLYYNPPNSIKICI